MHDSLSLRIQRDKAKIQFLKARIRLMEVMGGETNGATPSPDTGPAPAHELTECEVDCLVVLSEANYRPTTDEMLREMTNRGHQHGETTVKRSLAHLVKLRLIDSATSKVRGYQITQLGTRTVTQLLSK